MLRNGMRRLRFYARLPLAAKIRLLPSIHDIIPAPATVDSAMQAAADWLCRAQDCSASSDGGVARHYSILTGWSDSYPETSGYLAPTFLRLAEHYGRLEFRERARRILDWLASIQLPDGGFQGGTILQTPVRPVAFNTGQILIGLAAGVSHLGPAYEEPMRRAAQWLVDAQDADGGWRRFPSPFCAPGEKVYDTHIAWGLYEAARCARSDEYAEAARKNIDWALKHQTNNGWLANCCLEDKTAPLTHTLGYALRGLLESYRYAPDARLLDAATTTALGIRSAMEPDGRIPGRLDHEWRGQVNWVCLTGSVQVAECWLMLYETTGNRSWLEAGVLANRFVRQTIRTAGPIDRRGGVSGSWPRSGDYGKYQFLNWAAKFFIDSQLREIEITSRQP